MCATIRALIVANKFLESRNHELAAAVSLHRRLNARIGATGSESNHE
jgi:hypothetical protein